MEGRASREGGGVCQERSGRCRETARGRRPRRLKTCSDSVSVNITVVILKQSQQQQQPVLATTLPYDRYRFFVLFNDEDMIDHRPSLHNCSCVWYECPLKMHFIIITAIIKAIELNLSHPQSRLKKEKK